MTYMLVGMAVSLPIHAFGFDFLEYGVWLSCQYRLKVIAADSQPAGQCRAIGFTVHTIHSTQLR